MEEVKETPETLAAAAERQAEKAQVSIPENLTFEPGNAAQDLAKMQEAANKSKMANPAPAPEPVTEPAQTEPDQSVVTPEPEPVTTEAEKSPEVVVPAKYVGKDGKVNEAAIAKSTAAAVQKLLDLEKQVGRGITQAKKGTFQVPQTEGQEANQSLKDLINKDLRDNPTDPGAVLEKWSYAIKDASKAELREELRAELMGEVQSIKEHQHATKREREMDKVASEYPQYFTAEGIARVEQVLKDNPHLWNAPEPYAEAVEKMIVADVKKGTVSQVKPNPKGVPSAPVPTGTPAARTPKKTLNLAGMSMDQIRSKLADMPAEDVAKLGNIKTLWGNQK